jgi:phage shock protein PspC (stress-responsive transcriptional regulator)
VVRLVTAVLAILIPGVSLIPMLVIYVVLGYYLPESEEF